MVGPSTQNVTNFKKVKAEEFIPDTISTIALLNQTISATPSQAEVQAISDKVDELLTALKAIGLIE